MAAIPTARFDAAAMIDRIRSSALLRSGWWVALKVLGQALEFVGWVVLARRLSLDDLGVLATATLVARYIGLVGDWGAHHVGARVVVEDEASGTNAAHILARQRTWITLALTAGFVALSTLVGYGELAPVGMLALFRGANRDWVALGRSQHNRSAFPAVVLGGGMLVAAFVSNSSTDAALGFGIAGVAALLVSLSTNRTGGRAGTASRYAAAGVGWIMVMTLADQLLASLDVGILAMLRSSEEVGIYTSVYRLPNALLLVIGLAVAAAVPPMRRHAVRAGETSDLEAGLLRLGMIAGSGTLVAGLPLLAATTAIFGEEFSDGLAPAALLFGAAAAIALSAPFRVFLLSFGSERKLAQVFVLGAVANLALNLALVPSAGMTGAALSTLLVQVAVTAALVAATKRQLRTTSEVEELADAEGAEPEAEHLV